MLTCKLLALGLMFTIILVSFIAVPHVSAISTPTWNKTFGGPNTDRAYAMVTMDDGGYALIGTTNSYGSGLINAWVVKVDAEGNLIWNQTYSGLGASIADSAVQTDDGGLVIVGYTYSMDSNYTIGGIVPWIASIDASGNLIWNQTYSSIGSGIAYSVIKTFDGGYALVGASNSLDSGAVKAWLIKTDSTGNMQWNQTYGGANDNQLNTLVQTSDGGYTIGGFTSSYGHGKEDFWLLKTDSLGNIEWNQTYGGTNDDFLSTVIQTHDAGYALVGYSNSFGTNGDDFLLVKTDSLGNMQWEKIYDVSNLDDAIFGIETNDEGYALVGVTNSSSSSAVKAWLIKTDSTGNMQWNQTYGEIGETVATAIIQTNDTGYILSGYTNSSSTRGYEFWLLKTDANGVIPEFPEITLAILLIISITTTVITIKSIKKRP